MFIRLQLRLLWLLFLLLWQPTQGDVLLTNTPQSSGQTSITLSAVADVLGLYFITPANIGTTIDSFTVRLTGVVSGVIPKVELRNNWMGSPPRPGSQNVAYFTTPDPQGSGAFDYVFTPTEPLALAPGSSYWLLISAKVGSLGVIGSSPSVTPTGTATWNGLFINHQGTITPFDAVTNIITFTILGTKLTDPNSQFPLATTEIPIVEFPSPTLPVISPLDWCNYYANDCGDSAVLSYCRLLGYSGGQGFAQQPYAAMTMIITSHAMCWSENGQGCDGFAYVNCIDSSSNVKTIYYPQLVTHLPVHNCLSPDTNCGQPAADYFCQGKGFQFAQSFTMATAPVPVSYHQQAGYVYPRGPFSSNTAPSFGSITCVGYYAGTPTACQTTSIPNSPTVLAGVTGDVVRVTCLPDYVGGGSAICGIDGSFNVADVACTVCRVNADCQKNHDSGATCIIGATGISQCTCSPSFSGSLCKRSCTTAGPVQLVNLAPSCEDGAQDNMCVSEREWGIQYLDPLPAGTAADVVYVTAQINYGPTCLPSTFYWQLDGYQADEESYMDGEHCECSNRENSVDTVTFTIPSGYQYGIMHSILKPANSVPACEGLSLDSTLNYAVVSVCTATANPVCTAIDEKPDKLVTLAHGDGSTTITWTVTGVDDSSSVTESRCYLDSVAMSGDLIDSSFSFEADVVTGPHTIACQVKNADNLWSDLPISEAGCFYSFHVSAKPDCLSTEENPEALIILEHGTGSTTVTWTVNGEDDDDFVTEAQCYIDETQLVPGQGSAPPFTFSATVAVGPHTITCQVKDLDGVWSDLPVAEQEGCFYQVQVKEKPDCDAFSFVPDKMVVVDHGAQTADVSWAVIGHDDATNDAVVAAQCLLDSSVISSDDDESPFDFSTTVPLGAHILACQVLDRDGQWSDLPTAPDACVYEFHVTERPSCASITGIDALTVVAHGETQYLAHWSVTGNDDDNQISDASCTMDPTSVAPFNPDGKKFDPQCTDCGFNFEASVTLGDHVVICEVKDGDGAWSATKDACTFPFHVTAKPECIAIEEMPQAMEIIDHGMGSKTVTWKVNGEDDDDSVTEARCYLDGQLVSGEGTTSPFTFSATAVVGPHTIACQVKDSDGVWSNLPVTEGDACHYQFHVSAKPDCTAITDLLPLVVTDYGTTSSPITWKVNGEDDDDTVTGAQCYVDGQLVPGQGTAPPFTFSATVAVGTHTIACQVKDFDGAWSDLPVASGVCLSQMSATEKPDCTGINGVLRAVVLSSSVQQYTAAWTVSGQDDGSIAEAACSMDGGAYVTASSPQFQFSKVVQRGLHTIACKVKDNQGVWNAEPDKECQYKFVDDVFATCDSAYAAGATLQNAEAGAVYTTDESKCFTGQNWGWTIKVVPKTHTEVVTERFWRGAGQCIIKRSNYAGEVSYQWVNPTTLEVTFMLAVGIWVADADYHVYVGTQETCWKYAQGQYLKKISTDQTGASYSMKRNSFGDMVFTITGLASNAQYYALFHAAVQCSQTFNPTTAISLAALTEDPLPPPVAPSTQPTLPWAASVGIAVGVIGVALIGGIIGYVRWVKARTQTIEHVFSSEPRDIDNPLSPVTSICFALASSTDPTQHFSVPVSPSLRHHDVDEVSFSPMAPPPSNTPVAVNDIQHMAAESDEVVEIY